MRSTYGADSKTQMNNTASNEIQTRLFKSMLLEDLRLMILHKGNCTVRKNDRKLQW